jgi:ketosteroid isomerase-like protein
MRCATLKHLGAWVLCALLTLVVPHLALASDKLVEEANSTWNKHFNNGDAHALAALYDENAVVSPGDYRTIQWREEIEKLFRTPGDFLAQSAAIRLPTVKRRILFK